MGKRLGATLALVAAMGIATAVPAAAAGRADTTVTITCQDFLGTTHQVVDAKASGVLYVGNVNYTQHNGFGGTCSAF